MATQWEELVGSTERCLKAWRKAAAERQPLVKGEFSYLGTSLVFEIFDESNCDETPLPRWYGLRRFAILARTTDWIDLTPSETRSIFGALVCGAQASNASLPVFFVSSAFDRLSGALEVLGYEICKGSRRVRQYESNLLEAVESRYELCFLDGVIKYFRNFMFDYSSSAQIAVKSSETFEYQHDESSLSPYWNNGQAAAVDLSLQGLGDVTTIGLVLKLVRSYPIFYRPRGHSAPYLKQFAVHLTYNDVNPDTVTDNDLYTNMVPSKQPASAWSATAIFRPDDLGENAAFSLGVSAAIRRILGMYVIGKACPKGLLMTEMKHCDKTTASKAFAISSLLSAQSREALAALVDGTGAEGIFSSSHHPAEWKMLFRGDLALALKRNDIAKDVDRIASPPFGSFVSLLSLIAGTDKGNIENAAREWSACLKSFRQIWDSGNAHDFLFLNTKNKEDSQSDEPQSFWATSLWDDIVDMPDKCQSLLTQKLQMLRFCTAVKNTSTTFSCFLGPEKSKGPIIFARRLPATCDLDARCDCLSKQIGKKSTTEDDEVDPLLSIKVQYPALVSDIRAYKATFPDDNFEQFQEFYPLGSFVADSPNSLFHLAALFADLEACSAVDQKPMFNAEAEAEKALDYIETLSVIQFSAELLCAALSCAYSILREEASEWFDNADDDVMSDVTLEVLSRLDALECAIRSVMAKVREDASQLGAVRDDLNSSISQETLVQVDELCGSIDKFETWMVMARELDSLLTLPEEINTTRRLSIASSISRKRLVMSLALGRKNTTAQDASEARRLFALAKLFSPGTDHQHTWQSSDGRELASCNTKSLQVRTRDDKYQLVASVEDGGRRVRLSRLFRL